MSNHLAIATVTATLQRLLSNAVQADVNGADVTTLRLDAPANQLPDPGANLYLYQVTPNAAWSNADLPTRSPRGGAEQRPVVALDLHYLLSCYGGDSDQLPQRVLASCVRALHAQPLLTQEAIRTTIQLALDDDPDHYLGASDLAGEVERVKLTPLPLSLEDMTRLWSAFPQTPYSLSMAYMGTVVLIEAAVSPRRALPVTVRGIGAQVFRRARIRRLVNAADPTAPVAINDTLRIEGEALDGTIARVRVGEAALMPVPDSVAPDGLSVLLTDPALRAGVQAVQVEYADSSRSEVAALVLRPAITVAAGATEEQITLNFDPVVGRDQPVTLFLNELDPPDASVRAARAYSFEAPPHNGIADPAIATTASITFTLTRGTPPERVVAAGTYLVRASVSGAENVLGMGDIGHGVPQFNSPTVAIP